MRKKRINIKDIQNKKNNGEKIIVTTAYDYPFAQLADNAEIDIILVSDALGMTGLGYETTLPVSMDEMVHHTKAVVRGRTNSLVIATLPFTSASISKEEALKNAARLVKEAGADGVEIEGGAEIVETIKFITDSGIAVLAHIGLTRQYFAKYRRFDVQAKTADEAIQLLDIAQSLQDTGTFAILLECVPDRVAKIITNSSKIPIIGIGAGPHCDGQCLVVQDMVGLFSEFTPKFVKKYLDLSKDINHAFKTYRKEVEEGIFPGTDHSFSITDQEFEKLLKGIG